ncbi:MAG: leucine-rich repeat domain-containing protein [Ruminococcus sp.]|nr:leucine-rich repeat domain-containing protein [Ruminococcus sp.]
MRVIKKPISMLLTLLLMLSVVAVAPITAGALTDGDYEYTVDSNDKATITKYNGTATNVVIPDTLDGYPVTELGNAAFARCSTITNISIPDSVTSLGYAVFWNCTNLRSIVIPDSVRRLGIEMFYKCVNLTSATISNNLTSIGDNVFSNCTSLVSVTIPNSITSIGNQAFENCQSLTSITIPRSVSTIGTNVFYYCPVTIRGYSGSYAQTYASTNSIPFTLISDPNTSIYSYSVSNGNATITGYSGSGGAVEIPSTLDGYPVTILGWASFLNNTSLTSATVPDSVTIIGSSAFQNCTNLTQIIIPNSVTSMGNWTFRGCTSLNNFIIPDSVTSIGNCIFYDCLSLSSISIGNNITSFGEEAFSGCSTLNNITIPNSVESIGANAIPSTTTIYGYDSSTADTYASTNNISFVPIVDMNNGSGYAEALLDSTQTVESDGNGFGLDKTTYNNIELLGVQSKTSSTKDIRYVAVLNEGIVKEANTVGGDIADYGFVVAKCSATTTAAATENNIKNVTKGTANTVFVSCKGTSNNLCGDYGVCDDSSTKYKYVTMTINDVDESQGFAVRFFVQTKSGRVYYANYNGDYTGCVTSYSGLTSTVA